MEFYTIFGFIPVPVFWTNRFLESWQGGKSKGIFCIIRRKYKGIDNGILEHELTHCRQFYSTLFLHGFFYRFSSKYRLQSEVEAYKKQLEYYQNKEFCINWMSKAIVEKYNLNVTIEEIKTLLRS